jgi:glutaredoxin-related protein
LLIENKKLTKQLTNKTTNNTTNNTNNTNNTTNNITNNTTNNNTFNLNFFLTNTCKDAMNINEFIESIEVSIEDLKYLGKNGYVDGISKLLIDKLQQIDVTRRPLHCSDLKREIIHLKDNNEWTKEVKHSKKLGKLLIEVKRKNTIALVGKYQEKYPQCLTNYNSKEHKEYSEIIHQNFGGKSEDIDFQDDKILRRVSKYIEIDKNKNK